MRKILLLLALISSSAFAGDNFNGPYIGFQTGYADGKHYGEEFGTSFTYKNTTTRILFGGLAGYNKTFSNNILIGVEADYDYRDASKKSDLLYEGIPFNVVYKVESKINTSASLRAKLGYIFNSNKTLAYITGGYAGADIKSTYYDLEYDETSSNTQWHNGWILGLGAEHYLNDKFSAI